MDLKRRRGEPNRLIHETSPYLLQHAYNPVDWYPWGEEALERARVEGKPILLSIGYSACHWCHVMERESFEDDGIAGIMNDHFVNVKVDREERPDLDQVYQTAAQLLTGQGGWPLTVFLTPDQRPFYAGTYFPPDDRFGRPGFARVMQSLVRTYQEDLPRIQAAASQLTEALRQIDSRNIDQNAAIAPQQGAELVVKAAHWLSHHMDGENGGFGNAPKLPNTPVLELLLRVAGRDPQGASEYLGLVRLTLTKMATGGIYDQLGGGFHRYSVDAAWQVPHFEKMLYDNALLPPLYVQAYQLTGDELYRTVVEESLDYVMREMSHPEGGFYSSQDADSQGAEGKFFVWRPQEIADVVGKELAALLCRHFGVTERGNFEDRSTVLHVARGVDELAAETGSDPAHVRERLQQGKRALMEARERRVRPGRDEKVITGWNALMISAFAKAYETFRDARHLRRAIVAAQFIEEGLVRDGRLLRSFKECPSDVGGFLDDYAYWVAALLDLHEASRERRYLDEAHRWMQATLEHFWDADSPGFFYTSAESGRLIHRPKDWRDQSTPSGTGVCLYNMIRLHSSFDREGYAERAASVLELYRRQMDQNPWGTASLVSAYDAAVLGGTEIVVVARADQRSEVEPFAEIIGRHYVPHRIFHVIAPEEAQSEGAPMLWQGKTQRDGRVTAYVCRGFQCSEPVTVPEAIERLVGAREVSHEGGAN